MLAPTLLFTVVLEKLRRYEGLSFNGYVTLSAPSVHRQQPWPYQVARYRGLQGGCGGRPRIPFWSNPRIMYKGEPTGTAAADNARVILELAERVSKFR
jgi:hypothetical protein